jgi:hypothetical protein
LFVHAKFFYGVDFYVAHKIFFNVDQLKFHTMIDAKYLFGDEIKENHQKLAFYVF